MIRNKGRLYVFEGPDEVGKSTLIDEVFSHLRSERKCTKLSFPGNVQGSLGRHIYELHHRPRDFGVSEMNPASLQILHVAAHYDLIEGKILPALSAGEDVVLDRYWWSTVVYGLTSGVSRETLDAMIEVEQLAWRDVLPDIVFLISRHTNLLDNGSCGRPSKLATEYAALARLEKSRYRVEEIENANSIEVATSKIIKLL